MPCNAIITKYNSVEIQYHKIFPCRPVFEKVVWAGENTDTKSRETSLVLQATYQTFRWLPKWFVRIFIAPVWEIFKTFRKDFLAMHEPQAKEQLDDQKAIEQRRIRAQGIQLIREQTVVGFMLGLICASLLFLLPQITWPIWLKIILAISAPFIFAATLNIFTHMIHNILHPGAALTIEGKVGKGATEGFIDKISSRKLDSSEREKVRTIVECFWGNQGWVSTKDLRAALGITRSYIGLTNADIIADLNLHLINFARFRAESRKLKRPIPTFFIRDAYKERLLQVIEIVEGMGGRASTTEITEILGFSQKGVTAQVFIT